MHQAGDEELDPIEPFVAFTESGRNTFEAAACSVTVECCQNNGEFDAGLAVVEPLLAELQRQVNTGTDDDMASDSYPEEIARLEKLRDELQAQRNGRDVVG
jgi:hypothetical protein